MHLYYRNVNDCFTGLVSGIQRTTIPTRPTNSRNGKVLVIEEPVTITYEHPRERVLFNQARDANPFFHLFESLWMLAGRNDVASLAYYCSKMQQYSDDDVTFNGAYGYRWRRAYYHTQYEELMYTDQLQLIINKLKSDPETRRPVLAMWNVQDDLLKMDTSLDICCNLNVMFLVRDGKLDMTVTNRSNDLILGCLGANVCMGGETVLKSPEGDLSLQELARQFKSGLSRYPVYGFNKNTKEFGLAWCNKVWKVGKKRVLEIGFDDGSSIRLTPNHKLFKKIWNNSLFCKEIEAGDLKVGDRVWATQVFQSREGRNSVKKNLGLDTRYSNMQVQARHYYEFVNGPIPNGHDVHHVDEDKSNDKIANLESKLKSEHCKYHIAKNHPMSSKAAKKKASASRKAYFKNMTEAEKLAYSKSHTGLVVSQRTKSKMKISQKKRWANKTAREKQQQLDRLHATESSRFTGKTHTTETLQKMAKARKEYWNRKKAEANNHKITYIRELPAEDVYDFSVPGVENAMLGNGVMSHNCHFSMLQEYMACCIGLEVGKYHHISNNLHVYTDTNAGWHPLEWLSAVNSRTMWEGPTLAYASDVEDQTVNGGILPGPLLVKDQATFDKEVVKFIDHKHFSIYAEPFLAQVASPMCLGFMYHKKREYDKALQAMNHVLAEDWRIAGTNWILKRKKNYEAKEHANVESTS